MQRLANEASVNRCKVVPKASGVHCCLDVLIANNKCDLLIASPYPPTLQNRLMKGFSNQLIEKHRYINYCKEDVSEVALEKVKTEFDRLINLEQFLSVAGLQEPTSKVG